MKTFVRDILFVVVMAVSILPSAAATKSWRGGFLNLAWSDPDNWDPAGVPQDGDSLRFFATVIPGAGHIGITINDIPNLTVANISFGFNADFQTQEWYILGDTTLGISGNIDLAASTDEKVEIGCGLRLEGNAAFRINWTADVSSLRISGPVDLNGHSLTLSAEEVLDTLGDRVRQSLDISGAISGTGRLRIVPGGNFGTVKLSGAAGNTFDGEVTLGTFDGWGAQLVLDKQSGLAVPGALSIGMNGEVKLARPNQIADTTTVVVAPGGALRLDGHAETIRSLSLQEASLVTRIRDFQVETGDATLTVTDAITAGNSHPVIVPTIRGQLGLPAGSHVFHTSGSRDFALNIEAKIIGDGGVTKLGEKGLLLGNNNSFAGDIAIQQGLVQASHPNALGAPSGAVILDGGELELRDTAIGNKTLWVNRRSDRVPELGGLLNILGVCSWAGPITLNTNLTVSGGTTTFSGPISGAAGLRLIFNNLVRLSGFEANTYTGPTWADAALLELNKPAGVTAFRGPLIVDSGNGSPAEVRWLQNYQCVGAAVTVRGNGLVNVNNRREDFGPITLQGGTIATGSAGELGLYGLLTVLDSPNSALISGRVGLPTGLHEFRVSDGAAFPDLRIDATLLGPGSLRKTGVGQLWLAAASTYDGLTTVAEGALSVLHPNGLGGATAGTTVQDGATLELNFVGSMPEALALRGAGTIGLAALGVYGDVTLRHLFPSIYAPVDLTAETSIGVAAGSFLTVDGFISGVGGLHKRGAGTLRFAGNDHNTYVGDTYIDEGIFIMSKPSGTTAVPGTLNIGSSAGLPVLAGNVASYQIVGNIFVNRGGLYTVNGQVENVDHLWLIEGGDVETSTGILFLKSGGSIQVVPGAVGDLSTIKGNLDLDAGDHILNVDVASASGFASAVQLEISALMSGSIGAVNLHKNGPGLLRLTANNTYAGSTIVNSGTLQVDGDQSSSSVSVRNGGQLAGNGRTGTINFGTSGTGSRMIAPGNAPGRSPGILGCSSFNSSGIGGLLRMELNGLSPGSAGHDQLHVSGNRFGTLRLNDVTLDTTLNFATKTNDQFVIIRNELLRTSVIGTFNGLPEGANFYIDSEQFTISYAGGDGNDVVLTRIPNSPRPILSIELVSREAVRLLWPASFSDYTLQYTTNLSGANWAAGLPLPSVIGTNWVATNAISDARHFYRLLRQ